MGFTTVPDKAAGDVFTEAMWDTYIKDNFNTGVPVLLADSTLVASAASIDLTGIAPDWAHLMIVAYLRGDAAAVVSALNIRFNGDTGANYDYQSIGASAAATSGAEAFATSSCRVGSIPAATAPASVFGAFTADIPSYSQATNNKAAHTSSAVKAGTTTTLLGVEAYLAAWRSSAAITSVTLLPGSGNFVSGSRVTLYGMP